MTASRDFAFLVVTITTPFAPRAPYRAFEAASFRTVMLSMSLGLRLLRSPEYGIPSTIHRGSFPALRELNPLIRIDGLEPGWPEEVVICTPATLPVRADAILDCCVLAMSSDLTTAAEPVKASFLAVPKATTMTSSSNSESSARTALMTARPLTSTTWV